jgi:phosphate-selective porin
MKKIICILFITTILANYGKTQTTNDVLNLLIQNKLVSQKEADSVRAAAAITEQDNLAKQKFFPINAGKKIQLAGYTQVRYQILDEPGKIDGFDIRRARLDLKGNISPYWGYRLQVDFAASPKLLDAYVEVKLNDYLNFTVGQTKIPFSLENLTASNKLELIDRSQVVEALVARGKDVIGNQNGRDIGIQLGGTVIKINGRPFFDYKAGIFNGSGINTLTDKNENKDLAGRIIFHPVKGLDFSGAYYDGVVNIGDTSNNGRNRYSFDMSYDWKNLSIRSEYIHGKDADKKKEGYYVQAGCYLFQKKLQLLAKYDYYDPDISKTDNNSTWYVIGANFIYNANARLQVNYTFKDEEGASTNNNVLTLQLQIGF